MQKGMLMDQQDGSWDKGLRGAWWKERTHLPKVILMASPAHSHM